MSSLNDKIESSEKFPLNISDHTENDLETGGNIEMEVLTDSSAHKSTSKCHNYSKLGTEEAESYSTLLNSDDNVRLETSHCISTRFVEKCAEHWFLHLTIILLVLLVVPHLIYRINLNYVRPSGYNSIRQHRDDCFQYPSTFCIYQHKCPQISAQSVCECSKQTRGSCLSGLQAISPDCFDNKCIFLILFQLSL